MNKDLKQRVEKSLNNSVYIEKDRDLIKDLTTHLEEAEEREKRLANSIRNAFLEGLSTPCRDGFAEECWQESDIKRLMNI